MGKLIAAAALAWPMLLGAAVWHRASQGDSIWTAVLYAAGSRICHQRPDRSFHTAGIQWPVCGRCSGLYLGGALGALLGVSTARRVGARRLLAICAVPTAITVGLEWLHLAQVSNLARLASAMPLGAAIGFVLVGVIGDSPWRSSAAPRRPRSSPAA